MQITIDETGFVPTTLKAGRTLLSSTEFFPSNDPEIIALAAKITTGKRTTEDKVRAILEWLAPGKNIKFGGPVTGSRWGVKKVLKQKFGQCWDFSDCFITLCRASGVPCRQVGGWLYGASGHIWAEYLDEGKGWKQVDATGAGKLNSGIYHIPYFTSETGEMPILYVSMPTIEIVETK
jgi:transglutaminase-like putative cysteine protease